MANSTKIDAKVLTTTRKFLNAVTSSGIKVDKAIIFGSQATGRAHKWSDIDLCIVSPQFGHDSHQELMTLLHLTNKETVDIEPHPYHPKDLADKYDPLANEIRKYGIVVY